MKFLKLLFSNTNHSERDFNKMYNDSVRGKNDLVKIQRNITEDYINSINFLNRVK